MKYYFLILLSVFSFLLGYYGFSTGFATQDEMITIQDSIYLSLQLFALESGFGHVPVNTSLDIARFLAPVVAFSALLLFVVQIFHERYQLFWLARLPSRHCVICGFGLLGPIFAGQCIEDGYPVVIIERNPTKDLQDYCHKTGAILLSGDARNEDTLRIAQIKKAQYLFCTAGDDGVNLEIAALAYKLFPGSTENRAPRSHLICYLHLTQSSFGDLVRSSEMGKSIDSGFIPEFFNIYHTAGYYMIKKHPLPECTENPPHVLVVGIGRLGASVLSWAIKAWRSMDPQHRPLPVVIIDRDAHEKFRKWSLDNRHLLPYLKETIISVDVVSPVFYDGSLLPTLRASGPLAVAYICIGNETTALEAAMAVHDQMNAEECGEIIVRMNTPGGLSVLLQNMDHSTMPYNRLKVFVMVDWACRMELLLVEFLARMIHERYKISQEMTGETVTINPRLVPWSELDEDYRDANRRQARNLFDYLERIGCGLELLTYGHEEEFVFSREEIETLAQCEHENWMEERSRLGWEWGPLRDDTRKIHPALVSWDELPENEKEKDRNVIYAIPELFNLLNCRIVRRPFQSRKLS